MMQWLLKECVGEFLGEWKFLKCPLSHRIYRCICVVVHMDYVPTEIHKNACSRLRDLAAIEGIHEIRDEPFWTSLEMPALYHKHGACSRDWARFRPQPFLSPPFLDRAILPFCCLAHFVSFYSFAPSFRWRIAFTNWNKTFLRAAEKSLNWPRDPIASLAFYIVLPHILQQTWNAIHTITFLAYKLK